LWKSNEYYHQIHPTEAAEVDRRLAEEKAKAEAKAKADAEAKAKAAARQRPKLRLLRQLPAPPLRIPLRRDRGHQTVWRDALEGFWGQSPPSKADFLATLIQTCGPGYPFSFRFTPSSFFSRSCSAFTTILERKGLGRMQNRLGPNRVGPAGFFQFVADGLKMLTKEDVVPRAADRIVHFIAPFVLLVPVLLAFSVLALWQEHVPIDIDGGLSFSLPSVSRTELSGIHGGLVQPQLSIRCSERCAASPR
jgi:hypothetical protein